MTRSRRLDVVVRAAQRKQLDAGRLLRAERERLAILEARRAELEGWRAQYRIRPDAAGPAALTAGALAGLGQFIARLEEALSQCEASVRDAGLRCTEHEMRWRESRGHHRALERVVDRHRSAERRSAEEREQRRSDEHALDAHGRREREP